jgi:asparagine synthase (glutamine-hydrolysing)
VSVQAGIWNFDGKPIDPKIINEFHSSLKQQGPDGESCWSDRSTALLYRPFHTMAESRRETQPYVSRRGFILTWDGRLDNGDELALEFGSYLHSNPTDVDIVAAAFDHWDKASFGRLVGDWAISIWKPNERELIFGVDYMAIRHIFYNLRKDRIWWSTDLAPLVLLSGDTFHVDDDYIAGYFAHEPDARLTPYREIREVPPGHFVCIQDAKTHGERYWRLGPDSRIRYKTDSEYEEHFRHVFRQSVRRRLRSDSPILAELSGGLDSSSVVCMADDLLKNEPSQRHIETISYYDNTEPNGDDWIYVQQMEAYRGRRGHHIDASKLGISPVSFEPPEFTSMPGELGVRRELEIERAALVREGSFRVVLSGLGGDEFMGGIPNAAPYLADLIAQFKFLSLAKQLVAWSLVKRRPWIHLFWDGLSCLFPSPLLQHIFSRVEVEPWIQKDFAKRTKLAKRMSHVNHDIGPSLPTRRFYLEGVSLMANKLAKWSSSLLVLEEGRYPYLDRDLIEFVLSIPANQLLRPGERRSLMRRSLAGIVPQEILSRRTKQLGARTPAIVVGNNSDPLHTAFESSLTSRLGYIDGPEFQNALTGFRNGQTVHIMRLMRAISLEFWLRDLVSRGLIDVPISGVSYMRPKSAQVHA